MLSVCSSPTAIHWTVHFYFSSFFRVQPIAMMEQTKSPDDYQTQNNYDMTILHLNMDDDIEEDDSIFATKTSTHQKKTIPQWARSKIHHESVKNHTWNLLFILENELQIAICNQIYFHRNPSEIFGNAIDCSPAHLRTMLHSMLPNVQLIDDDYRSSIPFNSNKSILV